MRKSLAGLVVLVLVVTSLTLGPARGEPDRYVSHPGNIPDLHDFSTPQLEPGEGGSFSLQLTNRYVAVLENVTLTAQIYEWADQSSALPLEKVRYPPTVKGPSGAGGVNRQQISWALGSLPPLATAFPGFNLTTSEKTVEGAYFVRFALDFDYNGTHRRMRSRGHWNDSEWEMATTGVSEGSPGNLNLTLLGVDGLIPDSSFGVHGSDERSVTDYLMEKLVGWLLGLGVTAVVLGAVALRVRVRREKD